VARYFRTYLEPYRVLIKPEPSLIFCFDAFSSREPVSTSLENAPIAPVLFCLFLHWEPKFAG
jgi:hypothetical protein